MAKFSPNKTKFVLILSLCLLAGVSIWFNKFNFSDDHPTLSRNGASDEDSNFYKPPIDAEDEAGRFIQQASENYFFHEFGKGAENYRQAIAIYESRKDFQNVAKTYESLGDLFKFAHNIEQAESSYLKAVDYHTQIQDPVGEGRSLKHVGDLYMGMEQFETAGKWYQKSGQAVKTARPHRDLAKVYESIGHYHWKTDNLPQAEKNFVQAQETFAALKDQMGYDQMTNIIAMLKKKKKATSLSGQGPDSRKEL